MKESRVPASKISRQMIWLTIALACVPVPARAADRNEATVAHASSATENVDRQVDQVALSTQDIAINRLQTLLKKYVNSSQEPVFLSKLADIQQQKAAIQFRIAHGVASRGRKALDLGAHHKTLRNAIVSLDRLIAKYPDFEEIPHAYFLRGKAYEDIEDRKKAGQDYLYLVQRFPNAEDSPSAYMSLAEFAIDANEHALAITYLKEVEKRPLDPHYPFALYKLAWSHYNLKKIAEALAYAERHVDYYNQRAKRYETHRLTESDSALRENMLLDLTVFYFEGYEENIKAYAVDNALDYFKKVENGPVLGKMLLRFAKLLRSHSHERDLSTWKNQVIASQSGYPEALDTVILTYEFALNNRKYPQVIECARDMVGLHAGHKDYESFPKAQKLVLDTAESLQGIIVKNKGATEVGNYSRILAQLYDAFVRIVDETDPRIPRAHYNLAETLFTIRDYSGATEHYRWVVDHGKWGVALVAPASKSKPKKDNTEVGATVTEASLKAIASRYEVLHQKHLIPKELAPRKPPSKDKDDDDLDPLLSQWVEWLDTHLSHSLEGTENFVFESNRALYAQGQVWRALKRMTQFSAKYPKSTFAIPQASLVLDTHIASEDWERTHKTATELMEIKEWKSAEFGKRLYAVASDAFYKQLEAKFRARDYKATMSGCDEFLKRYAASARLGDTLALAGSAALENIDRKRAMSYFSRLIGEVPKSSNVPMALLARATTAEDHYQFKAAARDYHAYVTRMHGDKSADAKQIEGLRRKALMLTWLSGDRAALKLALSDKLLCTEKLASECERYALLGMIETPEIAASTKSAEESFEKARHDGDNRVLYAVLALEGAGHLAFRDRNVAITHAAKGWDDLDPLVKFALLPHFSKSLANAFRLNRAALKEVAPLKAHEKWITRRVEVVREMENAATKVMKLPWARIRAEVLNEIAGVYLDLARGLASLPTPKDLSSSDMQAYEDTIRKLTMPFEEKGQDMRAKSFDIASRFAIEDTSFQAIAEPFFAENPSQAKALKGEQVAATKTEARAPAAAKTEAPLEPLGLGFLAQLEPKGGWSDLLKHPEREVSEELAYDNPARYIETLWAKAVQNRHLQQIAFFMQEANEKALIQAGLMSAVKAVSLAAAGARGEALAELEEARRDLTVEAQNRITAYLARFYERSYAKEKSQSLLKELNPKATQTGSSPPQERGAPNRAALVLRVPG